MIVFPAKVAAARAAAGLSRRAGAGGGTSLPGKLLLRMAPDAIPRLSRRIAGGVVVVSATNGKTTTAKMLAAMLEPERRLCRNAAGANLASGVASSLLACREADLGVFEVDEAALEDVAPALAPRVLGLGNLFRDQLDRYGELEAVAARWRRISADGPWRLVRNADDPLVAGLPAGDGSLSVRHRRSRRRPAGPPPRRRLEMVRRVRRAPEVRGGVSRPPRGVVVPRVRERPARARRLRLERRPSTASTAPSSRLPLPWASARVHMPLPGLYNVYNALAAAAMACALGDVALERMAAGLEAFGPAFGRFERVSLGGHEAVLVLSKNPAGANEVIRTLAHDPVPKRLVVALNDRIADGRDVSWIWDVDFELLAGGVESVVTSGTRAAEMAVRLKYAGLDPDAVRVEPDLAAALDTAVAVGDGPVYVLTTYTAMLELAGRADPPRRRAAVLGGGMSDLRVGHLYPEHLNIYADRGNIAVLRYRCERRGIGFETVECGPGDDLPEADLYYLGGGQDRDQVAIAEDLVGKAADLRSAVDGGAAVLAVCGGYQLLGHGYRGHAGDDMPGTGLVDLVTDAGPTRMIGNIAIRCELDARRPAHGGRLREPRRPDAPRPGRRAARPRPARPRQQRRGRRGGRPRRAA